MKWNGTQQNKLKGNRTNRNSLINVGYLSHLCFNLHISEWNCNTKGSGTGSVSFFSLSLISRRVVHHSHYQSPAAVAEFFCIKGAALFFFNNKYLACESLLLPSWQPKKKYRKIFCLMKKNHVLQDVDVHVSLSRTRRIHDKNLTSSMDWLHKWLTSITSTPTSDKRERLMNHVLYSNIKLYHLLYVV